MKIASVLMSLVFAGVVAQANEAAPTHTAPAATATTTNAAAPAEVKAEKKATKKKHAKKEDKGHEETAAPAGH